MISQGVTEWKDHLPGIGEIGLVFVSLALIVYVAFRLGQASWHQRFNIRIADDHIVVRDVFLFRRRTFQLNEIKGFSLMDYPMRRGRSKSIILYVSEEKKFEFPEFLFLNFRKLDKALEESGLHFFGVESRSWRWKKLE